MALRAPLAPAVSFSGRLKASFLLQSIIPFNSRKPFVEESRLPLCWLLLRKRKRKLKTRVAGHLANGGGGISRGT